MMRLWMVGLLLLATGAQAAGGGITPWAVIGGHGESGQPGATAFASRVELSYARQRLDMPTLRRRMNLKEDRLSQDLVGAKLRLAGDLIYDQLPQLALGVQYKHQRDFGIPSAVGARRDSDIEGYLSASRLLLGYNLLVNVGLRYSRANEMGLLGFGGDRNNSRQWLKEGSAALFFNPYWAVGMEYRQKPRNLSFTRESDWVDSFVGYFPNKRLSLVLAYAWLGEVATLDNQQDLYLSLQGSY